MELKTRDTRERTGEILARLANRGNRLFVGYGAKGAVSSQQSAFSHSTWNWHLAIGI